jgi:hypothetical protein
LLFDSRIKPFDDLVAKRLDDEVEEVASGLTSHFTMRSKKRYTTMLEDAGISAISREIRFTLMSFVLKLTSIRAARKITKWRGF